MSRSLPPEIWRITFEYISKRSTLLALLLTSRAFHQIVEPIFYKEIFVNDEICSDGTRLEVFHQTVEVGRRHRYIKSIRFSHVSNSNCRTIIRIIGLLDCLKTLYLYHACFGTRSQCTLPDIFEDSQLPRSLRRLTWFSPCQPRGLASFIVAQESLEYLRLHRDFRISELPVGSLRKLRILDAPFEAAVVILPGRQITHLKTNFTSHSSREAAAAIKDTDLQSIRVLSSYVEDTFSFLKLAPRLKNLVLFEAHMTNVGEMLPGHSTNQVLHDMYCLEHTSVQCIRLSQVRPPCLHKFFLPWFQYLPSLRCIDVERYPVFGDEERYSEIQCRWYRDDEYVREIEWTCAKGEEWLSHWRDDVRHKFRLRFNEEDD